MAEDTGVRPEPQLERVDGLGEVIDCLRADVEYLRSGDDNEYRRRRSWHALAADVEYLMEVLPVEAWEQLEDVGIVFDCDANGEIKRPVKWGVFISSTACPVGGLKVKP